MRPTRHCIFVVLALASSAVPAQGFKFSNEDKSQQEAQAQRNQRIAEQLSTPCRDRIRNRKIMVLIGEEVNGVVQAKQAAFSSHFDAINARLQNLGLRTYTQEEIRKQIAQAEIDAYFKNNPDAALSAARRMAANYTLKGLISARATRNAMIPVNQVAVSMHFVLTGSDGKRVSEADAYSQSYSGADVQRMALTLINEQAEEVVAKLYSEYCQQPEPRRK